MNENRSPIDSIAAAVRSTMPTVRSLVEAPDLRAAVTAAEAEGRFRPEDDDLVKRWLGALLSVREALWEVLAVCSGHLDDDLRRVRSRDDLRVFVVGYAAAALLVKLDRTVLEEVATSAVVQRKLNEPAPEHRIPRKRYTTIFESFTDPAQAVVLREAMGLAHRHRRRIRQFADEPTIGPIVRELEWITSSLDQSRRRFLGLWAKFQVHSWRRRGASGRQKATFTALEAGGRIASELHDPFRAKRVDTARREEIVARLRPGDVLVTRHEGAFTNLFLPGYWPHAALFVGFEADRRRLGVELDSDRETRWTGDACMLEALKDGVRFRSAESTLAVDAVAVIRPRLSPDEIARGLERIALHEGKLYNFDFDFFRSDRLVCTEVVYRAFDGLGGLEIPLAERAGRPTLSAEDLLGLALRGNGFDVVSVFGAEGATNAVAVGDAASDIIAATLAVPSTTPGADSPEP